MLQVAVHSEVGLVCYVDQNVQRVGMAPFPPLAMGLVDLFGDVGTAGGP